MKKFGYMVMLPLLTACSNYPAHENVAGTVASTSDHMAPAASNIWPASETATSNSNLVVSPASSVASSSKEYATDMTKDFTSWTHTKSALTLDRKSPIYGFRYIYANDIALPTLKALGKDYRQGAAFATSFHELEVKDGQVLPGEEIKFGFMKKDVTAAETGGWVFTAFKPNGQQVQINQVSACFASCHVRAKDTGYVLSNYIR